MGRQLGVRWLAAGDGFTWDASDSTRAESGRCVSAAADAIASGEYQLVILDEITYPMTWDGSTAMRCCRHQIASWRR